jgi:hypothetical protein
MDQRKKINELLNKLLAQNEEYLSDKSFLYKIEKDIFLAQVRELYELLAQIPVHHQLEVGNEQELFAPAPTESLFEQPAEPTESPAPETSVEPLPIEETTEEFQAEEPLELEAPKSDNPVSKLEKLLAELRGWGQAPEAAVTPIPDVEETLAPAETVAETVAPKLNPEPQEVTFDLGLTTPIPEDRPSYFTLERKVQEDEWGNEETETTKPRVAIMNPFVGGRTEPESQPMEESKPIETPSIPAEVSALEAAPIEETTTTETIGIAVEPASTSDFSIVEVLQLGTNASLKNQLNLKPIDSLKTGIGLNEKFLYIRELFGNDHINFANTIAALNDFSNIQAAESLLHKQFIYTGKWDLLNPHVQTFLQTIYRRFA